MQINRKCGRACVNYHLSALKPLRSFGPTQRGPTVLCAYLYCVYALVGGAISIRDPYICAVQLE